jgi:uncharacterized protein YuzE
MKLPYLKAEYRHGKFIAAYLYLQEYRGRDRVRTKRLSPSVLVDLDPATGSPVGVEILNEQALDAGTLNRLLRPFGVRVRSEELVPQHA